MSRTSKKGVRAIARYEGFSPVPYKDAVGVPTIGYGHTGGDVYKIGHLTKAAGRRLMAEDLKRYERAVRRLVKVPLSQRQFDALVSFAYNVGTGALAGSTLLRELNRKRYARAANELLRWDKAGGRTLLGLTRRRRSERARFLRGSTVKTRRRARARLRKAR